MTLHFFGNSRELDKNFVFSIVPSSHEQWRNARVRRVHLADVRHLRGREIFISYKKFTVLRKIVRLGRKIAFGRRKKYFGVQIGYKRAQKKSGELFFLFFFLFFLDKVFVGR